MEELALLKHNITRYDNGAKLVKKKLSKLKELRRKVRNAVKLNEEKIKLRKLDIDLALKKLSEVRNQINEFENQLKDNGKNFHKDMHNLDDLKLNIQHQTSEVIARTTIMTKACDQLKMSHQLSNDVCSSTRLAAYDAFRRWLLLQPLLKLWLSSDGQVLDTIYATANYEGIYEEICAHLEAKDALELFADDNYWEYTEETSGNQISGNSTIKSLKQANIARFTRSRNFDLMHREMVVKLQHIVSSCEHLKEEINQRELLRQKMNTYMMDLSFALEEDLQSYLNQCEKEATKPATAAMNDMQLKILKPIQKAFKHPKVYLEKNTASNAVSILPTLFKSFHNNKGSKANISEVTASIPSENDINESIANDILQAYNETAIAYVKSFLSIKQSNTWKWCNSIIVEEQQKGDELEDIHGSILRLYPIVHGPVELIGSSSIDKMQQPLVPNIAPPAIRTPSRGLLKGNKKGNSDKELSTIKLEEEGKMKIQDLSSNQNTNEFGYGSYNSSSHITLSERETHYNLKPIDLDQMFHSMPTTPESYRKYHDAEEMKSSPLPNKILTPDNVPHQYRRHTLSNDTSELYAIQQQDEIDYDNLCMLYVSMLDLSAHSAITTKQVVRHLQSTSANITLETISQISNVLSKATEEGARQAKNKKSHYINENSDNDTTIETNHQAHDNKQSVSFELDTVEALENILIDDQVHALHQKVNTNFHNTRKEIESWISGDYNKSYVTFKRALIELLSTNQTNFSVNEKTDELDANNTRVRNAILNIFEGLDSSLLIEESSLKQNSQKQYGIDISKQIIYSIQNNIQEFVSNNEEAFGALDQTGASCFLDIENDLKKDEINFNPRNYAFKSPTFDPFNQTAAVKSSGTRIDKAAIRSASIDNISSLLAATTIASNNSVTITIPQERTTIHKMESVIRGKMFGIELIWEPINMQTELIMKNYLNKHQFKEYHFVLSQTLLSELISTSIDLILQILFGDSIKIMQAIIGCLHLESIDDNFYEPVTQRLASHLSSLKIKSDAKIPTTNSNPRISFISKANSSFMQHRETIKPQEQVGLSPRSNAFILKEIDDMLKPIDKIRRGSISSLYRIQLMNEAQAALENALSRDYLNENNREKRINSIVSIDRNVSDDNHVKKNQKEFSYLLEIVTLRKKKQVLLAYCFPLLCNLPSE